MNKKMRDLPEPQGLYDPSYEHDACGIGIVANIKGIKSYSIIDDALTILENLRHRGAEGPMPTVVTAPVSWFRYRTNSSAVNAAS